jgi:hypothetical protein
MDLSAGARNDEMASTEDVSRAMAMRERQGCLISDPGTGLGLQANEGA